MHGSLLFFACIAEHLRKDTGLKFMHSWRSGVLAGEILLWDTTYTQRKSSASCHIQSCSTEDMHWSTVSHGILHTPGDDAYNIKNRLQ